MTAVLKTSNGTERLNAIQGVVLYELMSIGGSFCAANVGHGKSWVAALAPVVLEAKRPIWLMPSSVIHDMERELTKLRKHFKDIPENFPLIGYELLSHRDHANDLEEMQPDLLILDECHLVKNIHKASRAKRVRKYLKAHPHCKVLTLSGSPTDQSLHEYSHMLVWSLGFGAPVPLETSEIEIWAEAMDVRTAGDLRHLTSDLGKCRTKDQAREQFRKRLVSTPGVVISSEKPNLPPITISPWYLDPPKEADEAFEKLRTLWLAADDWPLGDAKFQIFAVANQYAQGFYKKHDPWPPKDWLASRKAWCSVVRAILEESEEFDSEGQVKDFFASGALHAEAWDDWLLKEPEFTPNRVAHWLSDDTVNAVAAWKGPGIVWVHNIDFGKQLSKKTSWPYFSDGGCDPSGQHITDTKASTVIASIKACGIGLNLQYLWHRNLIITPPNKCKIWEQLCGRTHRTGQIRPVEVQYLVQCLEHLNAFRQASAEADYVQQTTGLPQKLCYGDVTSPEKRGKGPAWGDVDRVKKDG
jgi:hypothetical protein